MWGGLTKFPSPFFPVDDITKALVCVQLPLQIGTRYFLFVNHDMSSDGSNNMELKDMERNTVSDEDQSAHDSKELADNKAKSSMDSHDNQPSSAESQPAGYDGSAAVEPSPVFHRRTGFFIFFKDLSSVFKLDELGLEIAHIAVPAALALAADPLASLIDTAFIGRIGPVELAAVGVSIAIFNQVSKVAIYPLVSVTTSFVAEENASCKVSDDEHETGDLEKNAVCKVNNEENKAKDLKENASCKASNEEHKGKDLEQACQHNGETEVLPPCKNSKKAICFPSCVVSQGRDCGEPKHEKKYIPSVSSAMVVGAVLGLLQACLLISAAKPALNIMGVKSDSPMMAPAKRYLTLRSIGAPAVLLSLAMQGVFRGFKDTKTPLYASVAGDLTNIILDPILIFAFRWGVTGAAIAHVLSQYLIVLILFGRLVKMVKVLPPTIWDLKFSRFLKCGFLLLARVIAVTFCVTLAASMAARQGPIPMAAFQVCLQLWLATSLLADGLAVAGQAILASAFAKGEIKKAVAAASRVLQLSIVLGVGLSLFLAIFIEYGSGVFSKDKNVLKLIHICIPFVAGTQPLNSLAFVFDGVNFGASDYVFSAYSMVVVAAISIPCVFLLSSSNGFVGIWIALVIYITLRTLAGVWRLGAARGPWSFLIL